MFQTTSTLVTAPSSSVSLVNGARYCRVFWKAGSSATLGTDSHFVGHLFALTSIAAQTRATVQGQLLARNGEVTLDTNTITNGLCPAAAAVPVIRLVKSADDYSLPFGGGPAAYRYEVSNPGTSDLNDVTVTDDKIADVKYVSGDTNSDGILQNGETWIYAATSNITVTTTNTATATGTGVTATATDSMTVRVAVATAPGVVTETGGPMPKTSSSWYGLLLLGGALASLGGLAYWRIRREGNA